ncbi:unnamed protein product [Protopolystoma xenopodis]|uniref:Uncharacterized protein n=1 Tax=Protopolystoma xenopodis TaxID=117903 RepID=A0A3S5AU16_9PLAT|nr:unnamed protein product [Protopolystoma xenopodis]
MGINSCFPLWLWAFWINAKVSQRVNDLSLLAAASGRKDDRGRRVKTRKAYIWTDENVCHERSSEFAQLACLLLGQSAPPGQPALGCRTGVLNARGAEMTGQPGRRVTLDRRGGPTFGRRRAAGGEGLRGRAVASFSTGLSDRRACTCGRVCTGVCGRSHKAGGCGAPLGLANQRPKHIDCMTKLAGLGRPGQPSPEAHPAVCPCVGVQACRMSTGPAGVSPRPLDGSHNRQAFTVRRLSRHNQHRQRAHLRLAVQRPLSIGHSLASFLSGVRRGPMLARWGQAPVTAGTALPTSERERLDACLRCRAARLSNRIVCVFKHRLVQACKSHRIAPPMLACKAGVHRGTDAHIHATQGVLQ